MRRKGQELLTETKIKLMKRNKNRGSRQSIYYGVGEEGKCVGIENKKQQINALEFNVPAARLSHPVPLKTGTCCVLHCGKG
jgi:hypothetical protein